jgi:hypothetical protein
LVNENAKTAFSVTKTAGCFFGREFVDEEGAKGFVLPVSGIGGAKEGVGRIG